MIAAVSSHLKVHSHSSICSPLSDQGDWHKMVSSSQLIDYNLVSLQSKQLNHQFDPFHISIAECKLQLRHDGRPLYSPDSYFYIFMRSVLQAREVFRTRKIVNPF